MSILPSLIIGAGAGGGGSQSTTGKIIAGCRAASTTAFTVTYSNGSSGVGATLTNAGAQAQFTLDAYSPSVGERVLIKNQAATLQNGIYSVTNVGSVSTNWVLTRVTDFDQPAEMVGGNVTEIFNGTAYAGTVWILNATVAAVGTDPVTFTQINLANTNFIPTGSALTASNDTNVTLTLGGSPTNALLHAASITAGWTGILSSARGGTGVNNTGTWTNGGNVAFSGSFTFTGTLTGNTGVTFPTSGTLATVGGTVASVSGTTNQINSTGGNNPVLSLSSTLVAPGSIAATTTVSGTTLNSSTLSTSTALASDGSKNIVSSSTTATELGYVHGVTSAIQTQLNAITSGTVTSVSGTTNQINSTGGQTPVLSLSSTTVFPGTVTLNADPVSALQAVTKQYADAIAAGIDFKDAAIVATTTTLNATYLNGVAGIGATLVNAGTLAAFSVDGVTPAITSRILVKNQSSAFQNGVYNLTTVGSGAVAWVLTRSTDFDQVSEIYPGAVVPVTSGTVNGATSWLETATVATIGTDAISFSQFTFANPVTNVTASAPLSSSGGQTPNITINAATNVLAYNAISSNTNLAIGNGYYLTGGGALVLTLPVTAAAGTLIQVLGYASTSWSIAQNASQSIWYGNAQSTVGVTGSVASTNAHDSITLLCVVANTTWIDTGEGNGFLAVT